jgi:hypothetical protein
MITEDLIAYIQAQRRKNISDSFITSRLLDKGWHKDDVEEAFRKINPPTPPISIPKPVTPPVVKPLSVPINTNVTEKREGPDPYLEKIVADEPQQVPDKIWAPIKLTPKELSIPVSTPTIEKKPEIENQNNQNSTPIKPVFSNSFSEANPKVSEPISAPAPAKAIEYPSVRNIEVQEEELIPTLIPKNPPAITPTPVIPTLVKPIINPVPAPSLKINQAIPLSSRMSTITDLPNSALLHSYQKVLSSANQVNTELSKKKRNTLLKWLIVILILSAIGGSVFAFMEDYIKLPSFNFSFIKKDPKLLLVNAPIILDELKSYKIQTTASVTAPSIADITSGLVSGEAVSSKDTDTVSLSAKGIVNHESGLSPVFSYDATFKSSFFKDDIITKLRYNDLTTFVTTPDLSELLGMNTPKPEVVLVPKGQFDSFIALLPDSIADKFTKIDIEKLLSIGVPSYINNETGSIFKDFVNSVTVIEKEQESIHGVLSYHYELSADKEATKKLVSQFISVFTKNLSNAEKSILDERLGAVTLDSLEVWIGKDDSKIHQYKFTLKTPLSRLIGLDDKGIAGNVVSLDWKTTYYDFDVSNDIPFPEASISVDEFMKKITDMKIKDKISAFKPLANNFHNAIGSYGKRTNPTGSCTNPNPSSLFSPIGHVKGANVVVGNIAKTWKLQEIRDRAKVS